MELYASDPSVYSDTVSAIKTPANFNATDIVTLAAEKYGVAFGVGLADAEHFARNFAQLTALAIALWDERLSTAAVERELIAQDVSRARRAEVIDQHAAIFILQGALDRLANLKKS